MKAFIGIICGLKSEAKAVRFASDSPHIRIGVSGADAARAEKIATEFCEAGARVIISVGVSGGLDPVLRPGDLLIGESVRTPSGASYTTDPALVRRLIDAAPGVRAVLLYGSDEVVADASSKALLFNAYGAAAVDMESHGVAQAAVRAGKTFIAIRSVADPADRALPPAAMNAVAPDGSTRVLQTLLECAKAPGQFPALLKLGSDSEKALKTLRESLPAILNAVRESL